jgi:tetratricopeptide (TPR) repeat protein
MMLQCAARQARDAGAGSNRPKARHGHALMASRLHDQPQCRLPRCSPGLAYRVKGDYDRAIADYSEAIRINPRDAVAFNDRGFAHSTKGDYDRAIADSGRSGWIRNTLGPSTIAASRTAPRATTTAPSPTLTRLSVSVRVLSTTVVLRSSTMPNSRKLPPIFCMPGR